MPTLHGITWRARRSYVPLAATAEAYGHLQPRTRITWTQMDWDNALHTQLHGLTSGRPEFDLVMLDHPWVGEHADNGWLVPLDDLLDASISADADPASLASYAFGGLQWALPVDAACQMMVFRPDIVGTSLPDDWDELLRFAERFHAPPRRWAFANAWRGVKAFLPILSIMHVLGERPYVVPDTGVRTTALGGVGLGVVAASPHREQASGYVRFVMDATTQAGLYLQVGGQPGSRSALQSGAADERSVGLGVSSPPRWTTATRARVIPVGGASRRPQTWSCSITARHDLATTMRKIDHIVATGTTTQNSSEIEGAVSAADDHHGTVAVPHRRAPAVLGAAGAHEYWEQFRRDRVDDGVPLTGYYPPTPDNTREYELWRDGGRRMTMGVGA